MAALLRCPTCEVLFEAQASPALPFCCVRCQQVDLLRWLKEDYRLPLPRKPDEEADSEATDESAT